MHALAPGLVSGMTGAELASIRESADAIMGSAQNRFVGQGACYAAKVHDYAAKVGDLLAKTANCTCGPADRCNNFARHPAPRLTKPPRQRLWPLGLTAPRVAADHIQALMDKLTWRYEYEAGSRHTFAHAFLGDFYIATGHNAPISRENFDAHLGIKYAKEQAEARDKLWELEGYALHSKLTTAAAQ